MLVFGTRAPLGWGRGSGFKEGEGTVQSGLPAEFGEGNLLVRKREERGEAAPISSSDPRLHPGRAEVSSLQLLLRRIQPVFGGEPGCGFCCLFGKAIVGVMLISRLRPAGIRLH